jgi:uncharacterized integral membrane protein (TIGR00697 family)
LAQPDLWAWFNQIIDALVYYLAVLSIAVPLTLRWRSPLVLASLYVASYTISQYTSAKLTSFLWFTVPGGNVSFVATVVLMDLIVVLYGPGTARIVILSGFLSQILLLLANFLTINTPDVGSEYGWKWAVYGVSARVALASPLAYLASETLNAHLTWVYRRIWWARTMYSDPISLTIDTLIFIPIAFYGEVSQEILFDMIVGLALLKLTLIPINLFAVYIARRFIEHRSRDPGW